MTDEVRQLAWVAAEAPGRTGSTYPSPFSGRVIGRRKQALGDLFEIASFGVNRTSLAPGSQSSIKHRHHVQDEFIYVLRGELVLLHDDGEIILTEGMCAGFPHGGIAHHLVNRSGEEATYLEIGDRASDDRAEYPDDDLVAQRSASGWRYTHKNGDPY